MRCLLLLFIVLLSNAVIHAQTAVIGTFAGRNIYSFYNGTSAALTQFYQQHKLLALDTNTLLIADAGNNSIRKYNPATGFSNIFSGTGAGRFSGDGAAAATAEMDYPQSVFRLADGTIYLADCWEHRIRKYRQPALLQPLRATVSQVIAVTAPRLLLHS